ncbi:MAG: hypothetical protein ACYDC8_07180 [Gammaproteobacteria bacterium]
MVLIAFEIPRLLVALGIINGDDAMGFYTLSILWGWPLYATVLVSVIAIPLSIVIGAETPFKKHLAIWYAAMIGSVLAAEIPIAAIAIVVSVAGFVTLTGLPLYWLVLKDD